MAKVMVPVIRLQYDDEDAVTNEVVDEIARMGFWQDDELTFTGRIVVPATPGAREQATALLRSLLPSGQADRLLLLLQTNDWNVSCFVDCW